MPQVVSISQLVVEGKDDQHVIWSLCNEYHLPQTFSVEVATKNDDDHDGGVEKLLNGITIRIKTRGMQNLGFVIDADSDLPARWQSVRDRLSGAGYNQVPIVPEQTGTIIEQEGLPRVGVWIMPDNKLSGMLEDFVSHLIPDDDVLAPKAEHILKEIEGEGLTRYKSSHGSKAFIHTWLAWQETPGRPMGQSITVRVLQSQGPLAQAFINWLRRLFLA